MTAFNNYPATVLADSPIAYYRMDDSSGTTIVDSSGNSNNGTSHATPTLGATGLLIDTPDVSDKAITFASASSQYISCPTTMVPTGAASWSLECWFKVPSVPGSGSHQTLMGWGAASGAQKFGVLNLASNGTTFQVVCSTNAGDITSGNLSINTTYHAIGTYDGTSTRLYLNGSLVAGPTAFALSLTQTLCTIGAYTPGAYSSSFFNGTIDEVAFYTSTLSSTQVANHYNAGRAISKTLGVRFRLTGLNTKTLGVRSRISTQATKTLGARARISTKNTKTLGCRFVLMPSLPSGGVAVFGNGTGTASYDHLRVTQYPDPSAPLANAGRASNSVVNWNANVPANTSLTVYTSVDNGVTYQPITAAGNQIPGISTLLYSTLNLQRQPKTYYHLSEAVGSSTVADSSGNGSTGTVHGGVTLGVSGPLQGPGELGNTAAQFDGSTGYISSSANPISTVANRPWSIVCWIKPSATQIISMPTFLYVQGLYFLLDATHGYIGEYSGGGNVFASATPITLGSGYYYCCLSYDGSNVVLTIGGVGAGLVTTTLQTGVTPTVNTSGILIGTDNFSDNYTGSIAEAAIYDNVVLSASDKLAQYNAGLSQVGTVANDSFTSDTHTSYTQTNGTGGSGATWTWDTANSRLIAVGGSKAVLLYNNLGAFDNDLWVDLYQSENAGLIWGWRDASNYYEMIVKDSGASVSPNTLILNKISGGSTTLLSSASITFTAQTHHRFHVTMLDAVITISMDENQILTYTDSSPFPAGSSGLRNDTGTSYIYMLQITPQAADLTATALCSKHVLTTTDATVTPQVTDHQAMASDSSFGVGVAVPSADYRNTYVSDNIDAENTRSNYWWQVGDTSVTFQARNAVNAPFILQSSDILIGTLPTVEYSGDMYRNEMVLNGVFDTSIFTKLFTGDGQSKSWSVDNPIQAVPTITLNGLVQSVGLQGVDTGKQFYWQTNSTTITQDNSGTTLQKDVDTLSVAYLGAFGIDFSLSNTGQISNTISQAQYAATDGTSGIVDAIEDVSQKNMDVDSATDYANTLLQRYGSIARTIVFDTLHSGLKAGHSLTIFVPQLNIFDSVFLVVEVQINTRTTNNGVQYVYHITASENASLSSWVKYFSKVMRSVTGTKAKA